MTKMKTEKRRKPNCLCIPTGVRPKSILENAYSQVNQLAVENPPQHKRNLVQMDAVLSGGLKEGALRLVKVRQDQPQMLPRPF